jgi:hypothetical protein
MSCTCCSLNPSSYSRGMYMIQSLRLLQHNHLISNTVQFTLANMYADLVLCLKTLGKQRRPRSRLISCSNQPCRCIHGWMLILLRAQLVSACLPHGNIFCMLSLKGNDTMENSCLAEATDNRLPGMVTYCALAHTYKNSRQVHEYM